MNKKFEADIEYRLTGVNEQWEGDFELIRDLYIAIKKYDLLLSNAKTSYILLKTVLCDGNNKVSIKGAERDIEIISEALLKLKKIEEHLDDK
jgi:hypothetical protein